MTVSHRRIWNKSRRNSVSARRIPTVRRVCGDTDAFLPLLVALWALVVLRPSDRQRAGPARHGQARPRNNRIFDVFVRAVHWLTAFCRLRGLGHAYDTCNAETSVMLIPPPTMPQQLRRRQRRQHQGRSLMAREAVCSCRCTQRTVSSAPSVSTLLFR